MINRREYIMDDGSIMTVDDVMNLPWVPETIILMSAAATVPEWFAHPDSDMFSIFSAAVNACDFDVLSCVLEFSCGVPDRIPLESDARNDLWNRTLSFLETMRSEENDDEVDCAIAEMRVRIVS